MTTTTNEHMNNSKIEKRAYDLSIYLDNNKFREADMKQIYQYNRYDKAYAYYATTTTQISNHNFVENKEKDNKKRIKKFWYNLMFVEIKKCIATENTNANINASILAYEIREFFLDIVEDIVHIYLTKNINFLYNFKDKKTNRNVLQNVIFYNLTNVVEELAKHCHFKKADIDYAIQNNASDEIINIVKNNIKLQKHIA
jgi:hypothetical protein